MKKIIALLLALVMVLSLVACASKTAEEPAAEEPAAEEPAAEEPAAEEPAEEPAAEEPAAEEPAAEEPAEEPAAGGDMKVAFVTDVGNIDDHSFNQYSYEGVTKFCEANGLAYDYYKPAEDTDQAREDAIAQAINDGYNTVVMAGFLFGPAVAHAAEANPDVLFLALDVTTGDLKVDTCPANIALICYQEEQAGYLAGYAAVKEGYKELGFLGGIDVPAVVRYGYGFVQGADAAAAELGVTDVNIKYWYSGSFTPNDEIAARMDSWYVDGTEVVFACGGGIYLSCLSAADANDGLMIGVDVDQSNESERIITSAMKALSNSVQLALGEAQANGWTWPEAYAGTCQYLGAADDCVGLPMESTNIDGFSAEDYAALFASLKDGSLVVDNNSDPATHPETTNVTVDWQ